jgi:hypothetical protein
MGGEGMAKLRLSALNNDKPVKVAVELPATVHQDLVVYAEILARESNQPINDPIKLIAPILARFMATDRAFAKARHARQQSKAKDG